MKTLKVSGVVSLVLLAAATASALPQRINLRERDKLLAELAAKENDAKAKPLQRAWAGFDRRQLEMLLCDDKDFAAKEKALEDFIAKPGLEDADRIGFLFGLGRKSEYTHRRVEFYRQAEQLAMASTNVQVRQVFYREANGVMAPWPSPWSSELSPEFTSDARLRLADRVLADPLMKESVARGWVQAKNWRAEALCQLGRFDEAERVYREILEQAPAGNSKGWPAVTLARFYEDRAKRWYDKRNAELLRKAMVIWEFAATNGQANARMDVVRLALELGDAKTARLWIEKDTAAQKDQKPSLQAILALGDLAYAERNWKEAASWYVQYPENRCDWRLMRKIAGAFHAAGDDAKALECLKLSRKKCGNRYEQPHLDSSIAAMEKRLSAGKR